MTLGFNEINLEEEEQKKIISITFKGKADKADYDLLVPQLETIIHKGGRIRILVELRDFEGWTLGAFWEDAKFGLKHIRHIEKIAVVGEGKWKTAMTLFVKPFTTARVKYFDAGQMADAEKWVRA